jgi:hypothetical protein
MSCPCGGNCRFNDLEKSIEEDVAFLKKSPLVLDVPITGYNVSLLDLKSAYCSMMSKPANFLKLSDIKSIVRDRAE